MALLGSNGTGKTTLLRAISQLITATGEIVFDGLDMNGTTPEAVFARGLVHVPERRQLFDRMTVHETC